MIHFKPFCFVPPPKKKNILVATVKAQKHVRLDQGLFKKNKNKNQLAQKQSNTENRLVPLLAASCAGRFII